MKPKELLKSVIAAILVSLLFFLALEITQRVRWYFKSDGSNYWLLYGFINPPRDYDAQLNRMAAKKRGRLNGNDKIHEIQIWEKEFPNGLKKHNPDAPESKGQINSLGFRSHEFSSEKPRGIYRIIATGGSTTAGYESDIDHTYPALIE